MKYWAFEIALNVLTRNIIPRKTLNPVGNEFLNKWAVVLESDIGDPLEPHVEIIVSNCLEQQTIFNEGFISSPNNTYDIVQMYALPLIRRQFGYISQEAVLKLHDYSHDEQRTRIRRSVTYPLIPTETTKDIEHRKAVNSRACEMEKLGYTGDEIRNYINANRPPNEKKCVDTLRDIGDQMTHQLETSIINGTFVVGVLFETNIISNSHFTAYFG